MSTDSSPTAEAPTVDEVDAVEPTDERAPSGDDRARRGTPWPWIITTVAVIVAAVSLWQMLEARGAGQDLSEAQRVASETLLAVTNWDANELEEVRGQLSDLGTERLADEATAILEEFAEPLEEARATSEGEVIDLVAETSRGEGVAMAVVRQVISSEVLRTDTESCWGVRLMLTTEDGRWLTDRMEIYGPADCPAA